MRVNGSPTTKPKSTYSRAFVLAELSRIRGKTVPSATFYRWLDQLAITPRRFYSKNDLSKLTDLCLHYRLGGTTKEYQSELQQESTTYGYTP
ncbi:MAG: hypothetical protein F6K19_40565 [Cyanothece sp. SIO1E1]|nr:hypothetical protein [Cyanothece sp. SIO1E1]